MGGISQRGLAEGNEDKGKEPHLGDASPYYKDPSKRQGNAVIRKQREETVLFILLKNFLLERGWLGKYHPARTLLSSKCYSGQDQGPQQGALPTLGKPGCVRSPHG